MTARACLLAVALVGGPACTPHGDGEEAPAIDPAEATPELSGAVAGGTVEAHRPSPGRYATHVRTTQSSSCSQSWSQYKATASLVLTIDSDASVTVCRGIAYQHVGGSWDESAGSDSYGGQMQQGMSGTVTRKGKWLHLELQPDDTVCPASRVGAVSGADDRWSLRCTELGEVVGHTDQPLLGCQLADESSGGKLGFSVYGALPEPWILLGGGRGLRIEEDTGDFAPGGTTVRAADVPIDDDSWHTDLPAARGHYVVIPPEPR
ncbi:MAG: hypothetical protein AAF721_09095 [Myxococcota bacterium]